MYSLTFLTDQCFGSDGSMLDSSMPMFLSILDSMQEVMTGRGLYDRRTFNEIVAAMNYFDLELFSSQENGWRGMLAYYQEGGGLGDQWGSTPSK